MEGLLGVQIGVSFVAKNKWSYDESIITLGYWDTVNVTQSCSRKRLDYEVQI